MTDEAILKKVEATYGIGVGSNRAALRNERLAIIKLAREELRPDEIQEVTLCDAPYEYSGDEAWAWASGYNTCRDKLIQR